MADPLNAIDENSLHSLECCPQQKTLWSNRVQIQNLQSARQHLRRTFIAKKVMSDFRFSTEIWIWCPVLCRADSIICLIYNPLPQSRLNCPDLLYANKYSRAFALNSPRKQYFDVRRGQVSQMNITAYACAIFCAIVLAEYGQFVSFAMRELWPVSWI